MTGRRPTRVSLAGSDRARVPFAVVGVLVLVVSSVAVVTVETREDPRTDLDAGAAMDRLSASANAALRTAATEGMREAAAAPVTDPANTSVGRAITPDGLGPNETGYADATFRNYTKLRVYQAARRQFGAASGRLSGGVVGRLSLPPVANDTDSVVAAIDRVELRAGTYADSRPTGVVDVTLHDVTATVRADGTVVANRSRTVEVVVPTTVFEMHEQTQEYERRLETGFFEAGFNSSRLYYGFGRKFALRQYPVTWGKSYFDRYAPPTWDRAFPTVHDHTSTAILANDAVYSVQRATFGTVDPHADRVMRERWLCFGLRTAYEVFQAKGASPNATAVDRIENGTILPWTEDLNATWRRFLGNQTRKVYADLKTKSMPKAMCQATQLLLGEAGGDLPEAPRITDVVKGAITDWGPGTAPASNSVVNVSIDQFADAAYYRATGQNVTKQLREDMVDPENQTNPDPPDGRPFYNFSTRNLTVGPGRGYDSRIDEAIDEIYEVIVNVDENTTAGRLPRAPLLAGWSRTDSSYTVTRPGSPSVTVDRGPDGTLPTTTNNDIVTVSVTLTSEITHTLSWKRPCTPAERRGPVSCPRRRTTSEAGNVTFAVDVDVDAAHSPGAEVDTRGMVHAYDGGGPGPAPNFEHVGPETVEAVFGYPHGTPGLESALAARVDPADVTGVADLKSQLGYDRTVSVNASLNASDRAALEAWLARELNATRNALSARVDPVSLSPAGFASDDAALDPLLDRVGNHSDALVYANVSGWYDNPADKARAELRADYLDGVVQRIATSQQATARRMDEIDDRLNGTLGGAFASVDSGIGSALDFAQSALAGRVVTREGNMTGSPLYEDVEFVVDGSPTYLPTGTVTRDQVPAVRAVDGGLTDLNGSVEHAPMVTKYDNFFPHPGAVIVPWPGYWYVTLSAWHLQVDAEYARFEVRAEIDDPVRPGTTSYVRDARPVEMTLANGSVTAGRVEPIDFESDTFVTVVVPSYARHPRGKIGVGDRIDPAEAKPWGCGGPFPSVGPQPGTGACDYILD